MADEQICIHTPMGMICYENSSPPGGTAKYRVTYIILEDGRFVQVNRGRDFTARQPLVTGAEKLAELFWIIGQLRDEPSMGDPELKRDLVRLDIDRWHTITRKNVLLRWMVPA